MPRFGIIGFPLSHSFSPTYFKNKFTELGLDNHEYLPYELTNIDEVKAILDSNIDGFNITLPYKKEVIQYLDELDAVAEEIGAVNCVKKVGNTYKGFNTDQYGFKVSLLELIGDFKGKALVLGTGGAAQAVYYTLGELGIEFQKVSRNPEFLNYDELTEQIILDHTLIINTTPLGMYPKLDTYPELPYHFIDAGHYLYDMVYNPEKTLFLEKGEKQGARIKNGKDMLVLQAEKSWEIWNQP